MHIIAIPKKNYGCDRKDFYDAVMQIASLLLKKKTLIFQQKQSNPKQCIS